MECILWSHHEETSELPGEKRQCKEQCHVRAGEEDHARPGWTTSRRGQDSPWKSQSEWQTTEINGESTSMVWPTLGLRTAKEQNIALVLTDVRRKIPGYLPSRRTSPPFAGIMLHCLMNKADRGTWVWTTCPWVAVSEQKDRGSNLYISVPLAIKVCSQQTNWTYLQFWTRVISVGAFTLKVR